MDLPSGASSPATCPSCGTPLRPGTSICSECTVAGVAAVVGSAGGSRGSSANPSSGVETPNSVDSLTSALTIDAAVARPRSHVEQLRVGDHFSPRYRILKLLGVGGMGAVYQAWDHELGMGVALKVIRPDRAVGTEPERRFKRELVLARQVTHKNVIRIHDLGDVGGTKYFSMPYVEGADLSTLLLTRGTLPLAEMLNLARQIAAGLDAAHEAGVVHRDLKPANILVSDGHAIITDFGVAHSLTGPSEGGIVGTLRYMAPEQARGLAVDHRADVYAFGMICYEMLAGRRWNANADDTEEVLPGRPIDGLRSYEPRPGWPARRQPRPEPLPGGGSPEAVRVGSDARRRSGHARRRRAHRGASVLRACPLVVAADWRSNDREGHGGGDARAARCAAGRRRRGVSDERTADAKRAGAARAEVDSRSPTSTIGPAMTSSIR